MVPEKRGGGPSNNDDGRRRLSVLRWVGRPGAKFWGEGDPSYFSRLRKGFSWLFSITFDSRVGFWKNATAATAAHKWRWGFRSSLEKKSFIPFIFFSLIPHAVSHALTLRVVRATSEGEISRRIHTLQNFFGPLVKERQVFFSSATWGPFQPPPQAEELPKQIHREKTRVSTLFP